MCDLWEDMGPRALGTAYFACSSRHDNKCGFLGERKGTECSLCGEYPGAYLKYYKNYSSNGPAVIALH